MSRAKLKNLLLVNWRGIFYQAFDMDETITSLTGQNGAGKTTVMAAAYVALLPDQTLIDFRNQAGSGVSSKKQGLYGRFGQGNVAYSVMEIIGPKSERILAGVQIRKKGEPEFELIPFVITGLNCQIELDAIFLQRSNLEDVIIDSSFASGMAELEEFVRGAGGKIRSFKGRIGEYMSLLYEFGITPLRLSKSTERKKFNKLLQTSLFGGLSGEIQQSLKDYLLDRDSTLSNQISRAEQNLATCKQTRETIARAEGSRRSIEELYRFGYEMALYSWQGNHLKRQIAQKETLDSRKLWNEERRRLKDFESIRKVKQDALTAAEQSHSYLAGLVEASKQEVDQRKEASRISVQIGKTLSDIQQFEGKKKDAEVELARIEDKISEFSDLERSYDNQLDSIMKQLFDSSEALSENAKRAGLHKAALAAKSVFDEHFSGVSSFESRELKSKLEIRNLEIMDEMWHWKEQKEHYSRTSARFNEVYAICERLYLLNSTIFTTPLEFSSQTFQIVSNALDRWFQLSDKVRFLDSLKGHRDILRAKVQKFSEVNEVVRPLGISSVSDFDSYLNQIESKSSTLRNQMRTQENRCNELSESLKEILVKRSSITSDIKNWDILQTSLRDFDGYFEKIIDTKADFSLLLEKLGSKRSELFERKYKLIAERTKDLETVSHLQESHSFSDERLLNVAKEVGGDLLFDVYDNLDIEEARRREAEIGPLKNAIHIDSPESCLTEVLALNDKPDEIWLVNHHDLKEQLNTQVDQEYAISYWGKAIRIAKFPRFPILGSEGREREISRVESRLSKSLVELSHLEAELQSLSGREQKLKFIELHAHLIDRQDPRIELSNFNLAIEAIERKVEQARGHISEIALNLDDSERLEESLRRVSPLMALLSEGDLNSQLEQVETEISELSTLRSELDESKSLVLQIKDNLKHLEGFISNPSDMDLRLSLLEEERSKISRGIRAIESFLELEQYLEYDEDESSGLLKDGLQAKLRVNKERIEELRSEVRLQIRPLQEDKNRQSSIRDTAKMMLQRLVEDLKSLKADPGLKFLGSTEEAESKYLRLKSELQNSEAALTDLKVIVRGIESDVKACLEACQKNLLRYRTFRSESWIRNQRSSAAIKKIVSSHRCFSKILPKSSELVGVDISELAAISGKAMTEIKRVLSDQKSHHRKDVGNLLERLSQIMSAPILENAESVLSFFKDLHSYLEQLLPRDIISCDDPIDALQELEAHIVRLSTCLKHQEQGFSTSFYDVAQAIEQRIRKEFRNIAKLNDGLDRIHFGAITSVRIRYSKKSGMEALLNAMLNQNSLQLFQLEDALSFEEALIHLYEQQIGRSFTGDSLLDFRHYIDLQIQIRRHGSQNWESADSNQLSTGESIGVGLAILIIVLQSWEFHTSRITGRKRESLRFLFLDEASRLDSNSINTLADLCRDMELQLLIAAPSADESIQGTTYSLTRIVDPKLGEQVIARGLRGFGQKVEYKQVASAPVPMMLWKGEPEAMPEFET